MSLPSLVFLHGWACPSNIFNGLANRLNDIAKVHLIDLPGYGQNLDCHIESHEIQDWLVKNTPEGAIWVGWSLGAMLATKLAIEASQHISQLLLFSPCLRFVNSPEWRYGVDSNILSQFKRELHNNKPGLLRRFQHLLLSPANQSRSFQREIRQIINAETATTRALGRDLNLLGDIDLRSQLSRLKIPVSLYHGCSDAVIPVIASSAFERECKQAKLFTLPKMGHAMFYTHPDTMAALLKAEFT